MDYLIGGILALALAAFSYFAWSVLAERRDIEAKRAAAEKRAPSSSMGLFRNRKGGRRREDMHKGFAVIEVMFILWVASLIGYGIHAGVIEIVDAPPRCEQGIGR